MDVPAKTPNPLATIAIAFNIYQSWVARRRHLALNIGHGGNATIIYGLIFMAVLYSAIALSMVVLTAQDPRAGDEYYWTSILSLKRIPREVVNGPVIMPMLCS